MKTAYVIQIKEHAANEMVWMASKLQGTSIS